MEQHKDISIPAPKYGAGTIFILFSYKMKLMQSPPQPTLYLTKKAHHTRAIQWAGNVDNLLFNLFGPGMSGLQAAFGVIVTFYSSKCCLISSVDAPIL